MSPRVEAWTQAYIELAALVRAHNEEGPTPSRAARILTAKAEKVRAYGKLRGREIKEAGDWLAGLTAGLRSEK